MNETGTKKQTPYSAWLQTEILHTLQQTVSDHPGEYGLPDQRSGPRTLLGG